MGKKTPTALYAWDMWLGPPQKQGYAGCHPLSPLSALNPPAAVVKTSSVKEVSVAREFVCVCVHACLNLFCRSAAAACLACPWMVPPRGRPQGRLARGRQDPGLPQGLPRPRPWGSDRPGDVPCGPIDAGAAQANRHRQVLRRPLLDRLQGLPGKGVNFTRTVQYNIFEVVNVADLRAPRTVKDRNCAVAPSLACVLNPLPNGRAQAAEWGRSMSP